jgi:hypothetical protein
MQVTLKCLFQSNFFFLQRICLFWYSVWDALQCCTHELRNWFYISMGTLMKPSNLWRFSSPCFCPPLPINRINHNPINAGNSVCVKLSLQMHMNGGQHSFQIFRHILFWVHAGFCNTRRCHLEDLLETLYNPQSCRSHAFTVWWVILIGKVMFLKKLKTKLHGLSPRANYTDRATAACRRSDCQLLRIEGATWSAW